MQGDEAVEELKSMILSQEENECEIITLQQTIASLDREKKYLEMRLSNPDGEENEVPFPSCHCQYQYFNQSFIEMIKFIFPFNSNTILTGLRGL